MNKANASIQENMNTMLFSNLTFDHPLSITEFEELKTLLGSMLNLSQVYFKDDIDIDSIDKVKCLLEMLPNIDDKAIEKYIMKEFNDSEKEQLANMNFLNINTWNIAYSKESNHYSITSLIKYRRLMEWKQEIYDNLSMDELSLMEKVCYLYDRVKLLEYSNEPQYSRLPEIIYNGKANSYGYNIVLKMLFHDLGIPAMIGKIELDEEEGFVTLALIHDDVYDIDGIYVFDPSSDTILKEQYRNNWARRINYNFFAISLDKLNKLRFGGRPIEILKVLSCKDVNDFYQHSKIYERKYGNASVKQIESDFHMSFLELFTKIKNTLEIDQSIILEVISKRLDINSINTISKNSLMKTIQENFIIRNKELFEVSNEKIMHRSNKYSEIFN